MKESKRPGVRNWRNVFWSWKTSLLSKPKQWFLCEAACLPLVYCAVVKVAVREAVCAVLMKHKGRVAICFHVQSFWGQLISASVSMLHFLISRTALYTVAGSQWINDKIMKTGYDSATMQFAEKPEELHTAAENELWKFNWELPSRHWLHLHDMHIASFPVDIKQ